MLFRSESFFFTSSELDMRRAKADEVKKKLSLIYGDIELLQSGDSFLMGKAL